MWSPTHVQVSVCSGKGLLTKGKNGTNDAFVTISLGQEKFQTSVKQKALSELEWQEEFELAIPTQGNTAEIVLTALHENVIGVIDDCSFALDKFLGMVSLPLSNFDVYERPRTKWYPLKSKPGQEGKNKNRGEIEVRVAFTVKSGSSLDLSKKEKHKGSFGHLSQAEHNIVSEDPVVKEEKAGAVMTTAAMATAAAAVLHVSSPPSLVADGVPSIIIQDSFVVEQPSLSPSASPPSSKPKSGSVPVPKTRNARSPPKPVRASNEETSEEEVQEESIEGEPTVDFFNDQTVQISPVEKVEEEMVRVAPHQTSGRAEDTPINSSPKEIRRDRLFSLFSTPTSETDTEPKSAGVVDLDWLDDSKEDISQGFVGSEHLSDGMTAASYSDHAKTMDSAVYVTGEDNPHEAVFTPPPATPRARASVLETSTFQAIGEENDSTQERIQELEEELAQLKDDWEENEQKVRDECCNEWIERVTKMEKSWNERYEETKARYEEFCEYRVDLVATIVNSLQDKLEKLKDSLKASEESNGNLQKEMTRLQFEAAAVASKPKVSFCGPEVEDEEDVDEPHVNHLAKLKEQLSSKDEAVLKYRTRMAIVQQENERLLKQLEQTKETLSDVQAELEQSNLLLTNANERLDVREDRKRNS